MSLRVGMLTSSTSRAAGGIYPALLGLSQQLRNTGTDVRVFSGRDSWTDLDRDSWENCPLYLHAVRGPSAFGFQPGLRRALRQANLDILHLHGLWTYPSYASMNWSSKQPRIVSPHGMLDAWALQHSSFKKRIVAELYEWRNLSRAACLHALCSEERDSIRGFGITAPIATIPNGVDLSMADGPFPLPQWYDRIPSGGKILLFIGRIHPKKGLDSLISAMSYLDGPEREGWHLVISGWDQGGTERRLTSQCMQLGLSSRVHFVGPQYGKDKGAALAAADAFILPSLSEGLPMAVLEAWAFSLPVLMTSACNLPEGFSANAAICIDPAPSAMAEGLRLLMSRSQQELRMIGQNGLELVRQSFTWSTIAEKMGQVYSWTLGAGSRPDFVSCG